MTDPYEKIVVPHFLVTRNSLKSNPALLSSTSHLSDAERALIDALLTKQSGRPRSIILLENHGAHESMGLRGAAYVYDPDTVVGGSAPYNGRLFDHTMVLEIGDGLDERDIRTRMAELAQSMNSVSSEPYRLAQQLSDASSYLDTAPWKAAYGTNGTFIGVYRQDKEYATPSYYLAIHTNAGPAGQDLYEQVIRPGKITYRQLLKSTEYARVQSFSERNAKRVLYDAATALGVAQYKHAEDTLAVADRSRFEAKPRLAIPQIDTEFNTFDRIEYEGKESVVFYSHATPLQRNTGGAVAYLVDPLYGLLLYKSKASSVHDGAWRNGAANAFPAASGYCSAEARAQSRENLSRHVDRRRYALSVVTWKGRGNDPCTNDRLFKYAAFGAQTNGSLHREALGAQHGAIQLKPVSVITPPPQAP